MCVHFVLLTISEKTDEVEEFFHNPRLWLSDYHSSHADLPTHLVMFDSLLPVRFCACIVYVTMINLLLLQSVEPFLIDNHYHKVFHYGN